MRFNVRSYLVAFVVLASVDAVAFVVVFGPRRTLTDEQWTFLERQRLTPSADGQSVTLSLCSDCLNFAVFRRPIGGWETVSANLLQLANLPAFLSAQCVFSSRQMRSYGTSKEHSDVATIVLVVIAFLQCGVLAVPFGFRLGARPGAA
jgi:hypothetical protein